MPTLYDNFSQVKQYIDQEIPDLTSYVTKTELANASYATTSELSSYVPLTGGTMTGQLSLNNNIKLHIGSERPWDIYEGGTGGNASLIIRNTVDGKHFYIKDVNANNIVDIHNNLTGSGFVKFSYNANTYTNNIIPNETNTYTLGDVDHLYSATYSARLKVGNNSQIYNDGGGITFSVNYNNGIRIGGSTFYPKTSEGYSNGSSTNYWSATYTSNVWLNSNLKIAADGSSSTLVLTQAGNPKYAIENTAIHPYGASNNEVISLGISTRRWLNTYTAYIYTDTAYLSTSTYLPKNTYWYDGSSYHWLGNLFN